MGCLSSKSATETTASKAKKSSGEPQPASAPAEQPTPPTGSSLTAPRTSGLREATEKPLVVFVIGGPGSGKGTQCKKAVEKYGGGCRHLSVGDLLRSEVEKGTELGQQLDAKMKTGSLASDDQVLTILEKEISSSAWFGLAYLVDGFPRTLPQAKAFEEKVRPVDLVLYFECPEKTLQQRLTERGKSSGRKDDAPKAVRERLKTFQKQSMPAVTFFREQQKLCTISAVPPADEVFKEVAAVLDKQFKLEDPSSAGIGSDWRPKQVVDIENRFYGSRD